MELSTVFRTAALLSLTCAIVMGQTTPIRAAQPQAQYRPAHVHSQHTHTHGNIPRAQVRPQYMNNPYQYMRYPYAMYPYGRNAYMQNPYRQNAYMQNPYMRYPYMPNPSIPTTNQAGAGYGYGSVCPDPIPSENPAGSTMTKTRLSSMITTAQYVCNLPLVQTGGESIRVCESGQWRTWNKMVCGPAPATSSDDDDDTPSRADNVASAMNNVFPTLADGEMPKVPDFMTRFLPGMADLPAIVKPYVPFVPFNTGTAGEVCPTRPRGKNAWFASTTGDDSDKVVHYHCLSGYARDTTVANNDVTATCTDGVWDRSVGLICVKPGSTASSSSVLRRAVALIRKFVTVRQGK